MNIELFDELMRDRPSQHKPEWRLFLEICELYMKKRGVKNPVVVELGTYKGKQKAFYERLLGAKHIGVDISDKRSTPEILGNSHSPKTLEALKKELGGKPINILFIDGDHHYEAVKKDFEMYSPLCSDIVAIHDIATGQGRENERRFFARVHEFWDELKERAYKEPEKYVNHLFLSINQNHFRCRGNRGLGIGVIIKR